MRPETDCRSMLEAFLGSAFTPDELRILLGQDARTRNVVAAVSFSAAPATVTHDVTNALERHGLCDETLFRAIEQARPARITEIERLRAAFGLGTRSVSGVEIFVRRWALRGRLSAVAGETAAEFLDRLRRALALPDTPRARPGSGRYVYTLLEKGRRLAPSRPFGLEVELEVDFRVSTGRSPGDWSRGGSESDALARERAMADLAVELTGKLVGGAL